MTQPAQLIRFDARRLLRRLVALIPFIKLCRIFREFTETRPAPVLVAGFADFWA